MPTDIKPTITEYYRNSFKNVDNFNQLLGYLEYPYRIRTPELAWFIHSIKMMAIQTYVLWQDYKHKEPLQDESLSLKEWVKEMRDEMLA